MRHGRISELIRRSAGALLLLGSVGVSSDTLTFAQDANCATPQPCTPACSDDVYKKAGERLAQHLQQMGSCSAPCAASCGTPPACGNACQPGCMSDGCVKESCLFGNLFAHGDGCAEDKPGEPWLLIDAFTDECGKNHLKDKGITIGGWMQWGYQSNPDGAFTGDGPAAYAQIITPKGTIGDHEWKSFNLNQMYLFTAKVADGTKGFDWGYRADMLYGVDGNEAQSFGAYDNTGTPHGGQGRWDFLNGWDHGIYEWAMPQLYGEVAMGNLSVKAGHFYTPIGYEVVTSPDNFFLSRQITFYNSEPFTHTGALATYKVNDKLTVIGGWVLGMDTGFYQYQNGNSGIGGFTYAFNDKTTLTYAGIYGNLGWRGIGSINSAILSHKWTDKLMSVHQFDVLASNYGTSFTGAGIAGDSTGLINYLFYEFNPKWKAGIRQEWYKADSASYNTITYGVNYKPTANTIIRPEMRHLFANSSSGGAGSVQQSVNQIYGSNNVFGIDFIYKF